MPVMARPRMSARQTLVLVQNKRDAAAYHEYHSVLHTFE